MAGYGGNGKRVGNGDKKETKKNKKPIKRRVLHRMMMINAIN